MMLQLDSFSEREDITNVSIASKYNALLKWICSLFIETFTAAIEYTNHRWSLGYVSQCLLIYRQFTDTSAIGRHRGGIP